jgi:cephalosporin-C deacetylase-like acetyl esterase
MSGAFKVKIVSFKVNNIKAYGALIIPNNASSVPVNVWVGGFQLNNTINSLNIDLINSGTGQAQIVAIPALRGQSLKITINGVVYTSPISEGAQCEAFDEATDDVLAFLNVIQQTEASADVNRTGVRGGSRGGTVALLAGIGDPRVKRVVNTAGPANMLELTSQNEKDPTYQCQFLSDYKNSKESLVKARLRMIASSPIYFAQHLPKTQLHLGLKDNIVPVRQGYDLQKKVNESGTPERFELFTYDRSHSDIATDNSQLQDRIRQFFAAL